MATNISNNHLPSLEEEQRRLLTRTRQQLVEQRTSLKNQIRMKAHLSGINRCRSSKIPNSSWETFVNLITNDNFSAIRD